MTKQKFFIRLFAAYTLVAILYTTIVVTIFYNKNNEIIQIQLNNKYKGFLEQIRDKNDITIMTSINIVRQLTFNQDIIQFGSNGKRNDYNVTRVFNELNKNLSALSSLGCTLGISNMNEDLIITPHGTFTVEAYNKELGFSDEFLKETIEYFKKNKGTDEYLVTHSTSEDSASRYIVTIIKKEKIQESSDILVFLSYGEETLVPQLENYDLEAFAIIREKNVTELKNKLGEKVINRLLDVETVGLLHQNDEAVLYSKLEKDDYFVHYIRSKVLPGKLGWYYAYITPKNAVNKEMRQLLLNSVLVQLVLMTMGIGMALFIAKKMYKPIRNTLNVFKAFGDGNTQDELTFIQETASRIYTANKRLEETIQNNRLPLKHKFLRDLLYGMIPRDKILEKIKEYDLGVIQDGYNINIFEFININELEENLSREAVLTIQSEMITIIKDQLEIEMICEVFELDYKRFICIVKKTDIDKIKKVFNNVISSIEANFDLSLVAVISNECTSVDEIEKSFNNALNLLEFRYAFGKKAVITMGEIGSIKDESYYYPLDLEKDLINYVIRGKKQDVNTILYRILDENLSERRLSNEVLSQFVFSLVSTVNRTVQMMNKKVEDVFEQGSMLYLELKMCDKNEQLKEKVIEIFSTIVSLAEADSQRMSKTAADNLLNYIHENYNRDISLVDIASHFSLTPAYVSTLFKNTTSENFKDYLNLYRVEKAKEILNTNKEIKMKELAELVGCNSMNTFFRIFKKYEGMSPGQYLEKKNNE